MTFRHHKLINKAHTIKIGIEEIFLFIVEGLSLLWVSLFQRLLRLVELRSKRKFWGGFWLHFGLGDVNNCHRRNRLRRKSWDDPDDPSTCYAPCWEIFFLVAFTLSYEAEELTILFAKKKIAIRTYTKRKKNLTAQAYLT
ncbi:hypothetical protein AAHE18_11G143600 [Arachis hypogaea]